jgi:hypothetical protein
MMKTGFTHTPENNTPIMTNPHVSASDMTCTLVLASSWAGARAERREGVCNQIIGSSLGLKSWGVEWFITEFGADH